jgi:hypothetical protein
MLTKIAEFYESEVDTAVKALTSIIEPLMIVVVGGIVGFIVISMYLTMFKIFEFVMYVRGRPSVRLAIWDHSAANPSNAPVVAGVWSTTLDGKERLHWMELLRKSDAVEYRGID